MAAAGSSTGFAAAVAAAMATEEPPAALAQRIAKARARIPTTEAPAQTSERKCHACGRYSHWRLMETQWTIKPEHKDCTDEDQPQEHYDQQHECIDCMATNQGIPVQEAVLQVGRKITKRKIA